jgi:hypothetical protein
MRGFILPVYFILVTRLHFEKWLPVTRLKNYMWIFFQYNLEHYSYHISYMQLPVLLCLVAWFQC